MKLQDEQIHRKGIAKARVSVYAELCRAQVWLLGKNIPTQIINDFVNEFIEPANKLAQEALDAWNESEPEVKLRNLWNQWSEWSDKQLPENCEEFAEWYFYQITGTEVYHERADQNWVYQKLAENCGFESKDKVERIINQLKKYMKPYLKYGDTILYPMLKPEGRVSFPGMSIQLVSYSGKTDLVRCSIDMDHMFPNDEIETKFGLSDRTFKVTITPVSEEDRFIYGRERTYFSDIKSTILKHNSEFQIQPYPDELIQQ